MVVRLSLLLAIFLLLGACAKVGSPYGGPKDTDPPVVLKTDPPDSSVNFIPQRNITLFFDEFIQLENVFEEVMLSPPIEENVMAQVKGRKVVVQFPRDIEFKQTTYTLSFGNAIVDNNEGNVLENYEYIFSFKDYIDTLSVEGRVIDAFNYAPHEERFLAMLYRNLNDSAPLVEKPDYASRSTDDGGFMLHNLENGTYRLFALKDANGNMLYDLPDEEVAFSDSLIVLEPEKFKDDLVVRDSLLFQLLNNTDSTAIDSVNTDSILAANRLYTIYTELLFFKRQSRNQYMTNNTRARPEQLVFTFNEPLYQPLRINALSYPEKDSAWYLSSRDLQNDTVEFWLTDTTMIADDSLVFEVHYYVYDSLENYIEKTDTLVMRYTPEKKRESRGSGFLSSLRNEKEAADSIEKPPVLELSNSIDRPGALDLNKRITISSQTPVADFHVDSFRLFRMEDTIPFPERIEVMRDTQQINRLIVRYTPEELTTYKLVIPDSAVTDIYGLANDSTVMVFKTQALDFYGTLTIGMSNIIQPTILQLLDSKNEEIVRQVRLHADDQVRFEYLYPKEYLLKVVIDENDNGEWDTGDYLLKKQPEKVRYYHQKLNVRANWEIEIAWSLE